MKKNNDHEMRSEYSREELGEGVRGKYFKQYAPGTNLVLLSPDVATAFKDENAVNDALRALLKVARDTAEKIDKS